MNNFVKLICCGKDILALENTLIEQIYFLSFNSLVEKKNKLSAISNTFKFSSSNLFYFLLYANIFLLQMYEISAEMQLTEQVQMVKIDECNRERIPKFTDIKDPNLAVHGISAIYYEGPPYRGKPTKVFAYYGIPSVMESKKVPAVVLIHGGKGTAFANWVKLWNKHGYAAIAMDHGGCIPIKGQSSSGWTKIINEGGPDSCSASFNHINDPIEDQWPYYAVNAITLARNLIASFPGVDGANIGIAGISWGAVLTCIVAGLDNRYKFAIPVYGCGNLLEDSAFSQELSKPEMKNWSLQFDPLLYVSNATMPFLWVTGTNDKFFPLSSLQKTYSSLKTPFWLCVKLELGHSQEIGQCQEEIFAFADFISQNAGYLPEITAQGFDPDRRTAWLTFPSRQKLEKIEFLYTTSDGEWKDRKWQVIQVPLKQNTNKIFCSVPVGTKAFFFNIYNKRGLIISSKHFELDKLKK